MGFYGELDVIGKGNKDVFGCNRVEVLIVVFCCLFVCFGLFLLVLFIVFIVFWSLGCLELLGCFEVRSMVDVVGGLGRMFG